MPHRHPVYVLDEDDGVRAVLDHACRVLGLECRWFADHEAFLEQVPSLAPGCLLLDIRPPYRAGFHLQEELLHRESRIAVVAMSGSGGIDIAVRAMKLGAVDFLEKPLLEDAVIEALNLAMARLEALHDGR